MTIMLLEWVFTATFLILTVLVLRSAFGKRVSARLRYILWAVVLVRLLVPVQLFTSPLAGTRVFSESHTEQNIYKVTDKGPEQGGPEDILALGVPDGPSAVLSTFPQAPIVPDAPDVPEPPAAPDLTKAPVWLGWIWLGGSAAMALVLAAFNLSFARRLRRCRIPLDGTDCPLRVYVAVGLPSPCLFGLVRPAVYVSPEAAADQAMLHHVLAHEYTHFRHGDHLWSFLRCAALAVHWWNPLVWLAVTLSRRDGELACDEGALARLGDDERLAYGNTLLTLVTAKPGPGELLCFATTMAGEKRSLKERISRIACAPKRWLWAAVAVVLATVLACVCAFGQAAEEPEDEPDPAPAATENVNGASVPDDAGIALNFSVDDQGNGPFVRIEGSVWGTAIEKAIWDPETVSGEYFGGELSMEYQFGSGKAMINAGWTDESRTSVSASTFVSAAIMSDFSGYWTFTVDLSGETGVVTEMTANPLWNERDVHMRPEVISDKEAVTFARIAAKLLTEAEDYYNNWGGTKTTASVWEQQLDLNRDGVPETIEVTDFLDEAATGGTQAVGQRVSVRQGDELLWSDEGYYAHAGWNAVFLCRMDGQDHLLRYNPYMGQGYCDYSYQLFTLENGQETVVEQDSIEFDVNLDSPMFSGPFEPELIGTFMAKVNDLLAHSVQLMNTDSDLLDTFERRGGLEDDLGWLDLWEPVFVRDESKNIYGNLCAYLAAMEPYSIPTVRALNEEHTQLQLSYHGMQKQFTGYWEERFQPGPDCQVTDLNGDGRDEIAVILLEGRGTGCYVESLYLFDAETLKQYDTAALTKDIIGQIKCTGDKDNFYLSGLGMERVTIARSIFGDVPWLADTIGMGEIVRYTVKDGVVWCTIGCDASGADLLYCGYLHVMLDFNGTKARAVSCYYEMDREYDPTWKLYRQVLEGEKAFTLVPDQRSVTIKDVPSLFNDDPYTEIWSFAVVDMDGDGTNEVLLDVCGVSGDMGGYLLLHWEDGQVYGTVFNAKNNWSNRWFQNLKSDGTFECQGIMDSWESVSKLFFTAGGGTGIYGLTVIRNDPNFDLEGFMVVQNEITREDDWWAAVKAQNAKQDAVWCAFSPENIDEVFG